MANAIVIIRGRRTAKQQSRYVPELPPARALLDAVLTSPAASRCRYRTPISVVDAADLIVERIGAVEEPFEGARHSLK